MCGLGETLTRVMDNGKVPTNSLKSKPVKARKVFSSDPSQTCQTFCCVCDKVVPLSSMKNHARTWHKMTITDYKEMFGHPKRQILHPVYHSCALCKTTVLFDPDEMYRHLRKQHNISYKDYSAKFLGQQQGGSSSTHQKNTGKNKDSSLVVIRCNQCDKTFTQNIQLKIHKKKHSSQTPPNY